MENVVVFICIKNVVANSDMLHDKAILHLHTLVGNFTFIQGLQHVSAVVWLSSGKNTT
jgi:hypothetical protein